VVQMSANKPATKRKTVPRAVPVDRRLEVLAPAFRRKIDAVLEAVPYATVAETLRTDARQQFLYGFGRDYDDGRGIVTHSETALDTWHHYGLAADLIHKAKGWDAPMQWWQQLGAAAKAQGLVWGGDWTFRDYPHLQWGAPMRRSPSPSAAKFLADGGVEAVWRVVKAL
jgi:peptidoglycan L-alanyl-D-glutamate endopeptidase CwlK